MPTLVQRLQHGWNAFISNRDPASVSAQYLGTGSYYDPMRARRFIQNERSIITAIYTRIAVDCAALDIRHVQLDDKGRYLKTIDSGLNECLNVEANIDQTGRAFRQDVYMSMLEEGSVVIVPVDTTINPAVSGSYDIKSVRVGKVVQWYPKHVRVEVYNDAFGRRQELTLPKKVVTIVQNPFYEVMNEPNSTLQRLIRKLNLLDAIDEQSGSGKLDLLIQLPYVIKSDARRQQAEIRRKDIEMQLAGSKYGIAYIDGTERVTQLNRSLDNNMMKQIEYLTETLYGQLGVTDKVMNGTADEQEMLNYNNRTVEPIVAALVDGMKRTFITKSARTQGKSILYFREPFKLVPVNDLAEIADKFTRNEILTSNEVRGLIGFMPSDDPRADELRNSNVSHDNDIGNDTGTETVPKENQNESEETAFR